METHAWDTDSVFQDVDSLLGVEVSASFPEPQGREPHPDYCSKAGSLRRYACPFL